MDNDFLTENGTTISINSSDAAIFFEFGQPCKFYFADDPSDICKVFLFLSLNLLMILLLLIFTCSLIQNHQIKVSILSKFYQMLCMAIISLTHTGQIFCGNTQLGFPVIDVVPVHNSFIQ